MLQQPAEKADTRQLSGSQFQTTCHVCLFVAVTEGQEPVGSCLFSQQGSVLDVAPCVAVYLDVAEYLDVTCGAGACTLGHAALTGVESTVQR
jgi:hypothetical protein